MVGDGDIGHSAVLVILEGGRVFNADIATSGGYCSKVLFSTRLVPIYQANIPVLRLRLYHRLHI